MELKARSFVFTNGGVAITGASSPTTHCVGVFIERSGTSNGVLYAYNYVNNVAVGPDHFA